MLRSLHNIRPGKFLLPCSREAFHTRKSVVQVCTDSWWKIGVVGSCTISRVSMHSRLVDACWLLLTPAHCSEQVKEEYCRSHHLILDSCKLFSEQGRLLQVPLHDDELLQQRQVWMAAICTDDCAAAEANALLHSRQAFSEIFAMMRSVLTGSQCISGACVSHLFPCAYQKSLHNLAQTAMVHHCCQLQPC